MNKELILKYKIEFDHWLNGGKLQTKAVYDIWVEAPNNIFESSVVNLTLVIDDEYVEFRKALAEGKTIQYLPDDSSDWKDCTNQTSPSRQFLVHPTKYRIKPEEPKFKVGDWCWVGYKLMKFNKLIKEDYNTTFEFISPNRDADGYKIKEHILERHLQVVEPFIGQLPSYLKE